MFGFDSGGERVVFGCGVGGGRSCAWIEERGRVRGW